MKSNIIEFSNIHGDFKLNIGEIYDIDVVDGIGEVVPLSNVKVVLKNGERIYFEDTDGVKFPILIELIAHETLVD